MISRAVGCCLRARNSSVSASDRRMKNRNGMMTQPIQSGMRHPHADICCGVSVDVSATPSSAAKMTAHCWLADCQLT